LNTIHGNRILNKPPYLVVDCNLCTKSPQEKERA
jgi:hypothetical protein